MSTGIFDINVTAIIQSIIDGSKNSDSYFDSYLTEQLGSEAIKIFGDKFNRTFFDNFIYESTGWRVEQVANLSDESCAALSLQIIVREWEILKLEDEAPETLSPAWWKIHQEKVECGEVSPRFFLGEDGNIYYTIESMRGIK